MANFVQTLKITIPIIWYYNWFLIYFIWFRSLCLGLVVQKPNRLKCGSDRDDKITYDQLIKCFNTD